MNKLIYDIGGSNIKFALMTNDGEILARKKVPTPYDGAESYFNMLAELGREYLGQADGVGISTNGRMEMDGNTYRAYTRDFLFGLDLKQEMEKRLSLPVVIENDGVAATLGEWWKGAGQGAKILLGVVLGTGLGGAILIDGKPLRGAHNNSAMVFGMLSTSDPASGTYRISGLETTLPLLLMQAAFAKGMDPREMTGPKLFELAASGDPVVNALLDKYYKANAAVIFNSAALLDVDRVVITGGLAQQDSLFKAIATEVNEIVEKGFQIPGLDLGPFGSMIDFKDFRFDVRRGEKLLDANLYGALYRVLEEMKQL